MSDEVMATIIIDIKPGTRAELTRQAAADGTALEPYAASLLEKAAHAGRLAQALTKSELERTLQELALVLL